MHLIDGAGHVSNTFVAEDTATMRPPTEITPEIMNAFQFELANVVLWALGAGSLNKADNTQLKQALMAKFAQLASPTFTGTPLVPTAAAGTNTQQAASTAFVQAAIAALIGGSPAALDTLKELADALGDDANYAATMTNLMAGKAGLALANIFTKGQSGTWAALPATTGTLAPDFTASNLFTGQVTGNITFGNGYTGPGAGKGGSFIIRVQQNGATLYNWSFGSNWKYVGGPSAIPSQTQILGDWDTIVGQVLTDGTIEFAVRNDPK
jgi:hypothetical protein